MKPEVKSILKASGLKATPKRIKLLELLSSIHKPLTIRDILRQIKGVRIDQATIYRNLDKLKQMGVVKEIELQQGKSYFELVGHDHHHIVCTNCGRIEDFIGCQFESLSKKALQQSKLFSNIKQHSLELFGVCNPCSRKI